MTEDFGALNPGAANYRPYLDEMAAWRHAAQAEQGLKSGLADISPPAPAPHQETPPETPPEPPAAEPEPETVQETPAPEPDPQEAEEASESSFDPAAYNAIRVLRYLKSASSAEIARVMELELRGKARKGILGQEEDLLDKARKREN